MCGGLFTCGRGMIVVGLMVALVGTVNGSGKNDTAVSSQTESPDQTTTSPDDQTTTIPDETTPRPQAIPFNCTRAYPPYLELTIAYLRDVKYPTIPYKPRYDLGYVPYPAYIWEKVLEECCPTNSTLNCTQLILGQIVERECGQPKLRYGCYRCQERHGLYGRPNDCTNGWEKTKDEESNGGPPGKLPLTFGIILLTALFPLFPFF